MQPHPRLGHDSRPSFSAILVAGSWNEPYNLLARNVEQAGYLVLVAHSGAEALAIAKTHSRPIHLLLADDTVASPALIRDLSPYQPEIRVLVIAAPEETLARIKELLEPGEEY